MKTKMLLLLLLCSASLFAGPFVTGAHTVSTEICQTATAVTGAVIVLLTLTSIGGGLNGRIFLALIESAIFVFIFMNPNTISQFFNFGG